MHLLSYFQCSLGVCHSWRSSKQLHRILSALAASDLSLHTLSDIQVEIRWEHLEGNRVFSNESINYVLVGVKSKLHFHTFLAIQKVCSKKTFRAAFNYRNFFWHHSEQLWGTFFPKFKLEILIFNLRISMVGSIFLVISVAIERHSAVCNPLAYR